MNTVLERITDWFARAQKANWQAKALAANCRVSLRTLERFFLSRKGQSPKEWLKSERQKRAKYLLRDCSVKEAAAILGYKHAQHFSRDFKKHYGHAPTSLTITEPAGESLDELLI